MHTNYRSRRGILAFAMLVLFVGMSCSLFSRGVDDPVPEGEQIPPPMPTTEGIRQDELPIPIVPDAKNFSSSQESFSYTTQLSAEEVGKFYEEKFPPLGWTIGEQGNMAGTLMWEISRQGVTYLLVIMPSNGMTVVDAAPIK